MGDPPADRKPGGVWGALRRLARKARDSVRVLRDEYRAGRDEGDETDKGDEVERERRTVSHRDIGPVSEEEPPPSS